MNKNYKNIAVYLLVFAVFVLTPYWALGKNLSVLESEQSILRQENSSLYSDIEVRKEIYKKYADIESMQNILDTNLAEYTNPSLIIDNLTSEAYAKELTVTSISQVREDSLSTYLDRWVTTIKFNGSKENVNSFAESALDKTNNNSSILKDLTVVILSEDVYSVTVSIVSFLEK